MCIYSQFFPCLCFTLLGVVVVLQLAGLGRRRSPKDSLEAPGQFYFIYYVTALAAFTDLSALLGQNQRRARPSDSSVQRRS